MFTALRIAIVVGLIVYFSPVRRADGPTAPSGAAGQDLWPAQAVSTALPDVARRSILDRMLATGTWPFRTQAARSAAFPSRDTLLPQDLQPPWRGDEESPVRPPDAHPGRAGARAAR